MYLISHIEVKSTYISYENLTKKICNFSLASQSLSSFYSIKAQYSTKSSHAFKMLMLLRNI